MVSDLSAMLFTSLILAIILFFIWSFWLKRRSLIHKFYLLFSGGYALLVLALLAMKFSPHNSIAWQFVWDACTNSFGAFLPVLYLCISLAFARGWAHMPRWGYALFMIPVVSNLVVWTNPLHHLQYQVFSVVKSELVFGPYAMVSGIYSYLCLIAGIAVVVRFAIRSHRNHSRLYLKQCLLIITAVSYTHLSAPKNMNRCYIPLTTTLPSWKRLGFTLFLQMSYGIIPIGLPLSAAE